MYSICGEIEARSDLLITLVILHSLIFLLLAQCSFPYSLNADDRRLSKAPESRQHLKNIWLFNITADPNEQQDLSESHPQIVRQLLDRLAYYNSTAVPCLFENTDPQSNPELHGGAWSPWLE